MARHLLEEVSSPQGQLVIPPRRRQLLQVAQELKDRLRFRCGGPSCYAGCVIASCSSVLQLLYDYSQLYEEHHTHGVSPQQHGLRNIRDNSSVAQELKDRLNFRQASFTLSDSAEKPCLPSSRSVMLKFSACNLCAACVTPQNCFCSKLYSDLHPAEGAQVLTACSAQQPAGLEHAQEPCNKDVR